MIKSSSVTINFSTNPFALAGVRPEILESELIDPATRKLAHSMLSRQVFLSHPDRNKEEQDLSYQLRLLDALKAMSLSSKEIQSVGSKYIEELLPLIENFKARAKFIEQEENNRAQRKSFLSKILKYAHFTPTIPTGHSLQLTVIDSQAVYEELLKHAKMEKKKDLDSYSNKFTVNYRRALLEHWSIQLTVSDWMLNGSREFDRLIDHPKVKARLKEYVHEMENTLHPEDSVVSHPQSLIASWISFRKELVAQPKKWLDKILINQLPLSSYAGSHLYCALKKSSKFINAAIHRHLVSERYSYAEASSQILLRLKTKKESFSKAEIARERLKLALEDLLCAYDKKLMELFTLNNNRKTSERIFIPQLTDEFDLNVVEKAGFQAFNEITDLGQSPYLKRVLEAQKKLFEDSTTRDTRINEELDSDAKKVCSVIAKYVSSAEKIVINQNGQVSNTDLVDPSWLYCGYLRLNGDTSPGRYLPNTYSAHSLSHQHLVTPGNTISFDEFCLLERYFTPGYLPNYHCKREMDGQEMASYPFLFPVFVKYSQKERNSSYLILGEMFKSELVPKVKKNI